MFTAQYFGSGGLRCSPLNAALVANEKNGAKTKCLGLRSSAFWLGFRISTSSCLGLWKSIVVSFVVGFSISETDLYVES
ncbi:hypothetical protein CGI38_23595 [Vibrio parahaemolyticus]|nr:hypothetical protein CGI38_23595 [Vibrio parahaemolyticus]